LRLRFEVVDCAMESVDVFRLKAIVRDLVRGGALIGMAGVVKVGLGVVSGEV